MAAVLLICLFDMPYGYYNMVRFVAMIVFGISAYRYNEEDREGLSIGMFALALLFQPFVPIALGRSLWCMVDIIVAIFLLKLWNDERVKSIE